MATILTAAATGMQAAARVTDHIGNNIANASAYGFKVRRPVNEGDPTIATSSGSNRLGVALTTADFDMNPGVFESTGDALNFGVQDDAFYRVTNTDGGTAYSRTGALQVDGDGNILDFAGHFLQPPVTLPSGFTSPAVNADGSISAVDGSGEPQTIGSLSFVRFVNAKGLREVGGGLYSETAATGAIIEGVPGDGFAALQPGVIEGSNVNLADEMANLVVAQRAYQASAKAFSVGDQMLALATDVTQ